MQVAAGDQIRFAALKQLAFRSTDNMVSRVTITATGLSLYYCITLSARAFHAHRAAFVVPCANFRTQKLPRVDVATLWLPSTGVVMLLQLYRLIFDHLLLVDHVKRIAHRVTQFA